MILPSGLKIFRAPEASGSLDGSQRVGDAQVPEILHLRALYARETSDAEELELIKSFAED